jgi:uncharacterized membrane protein YfcA
MLHVIQSAMLVPALWRDAPRTALYRLLLGAALGCPLGFALFLFADVRLLKLLVGVLILSVTAVIVGRERGLLDALPGPTHPGPATEIDARAWPTTTTGAVSGTMTALLVMPGPPLMIWLMGSALGKVEARALSLTFFAICYGAVSLLGIAAGQVDRTTWLLALMLAPAVVLGTMAGTRMNRLISESRFRQVVLALLLLSGLGAMASALA